MLETRFTMSAEDTIPTVPVSTDTPEETPEPPTAEKLPPECFYG